MRILIAEDDAVSAKVLAKMLEPFGKCDTVQNGREAIDAFRGALNQGEVYNMVCLDIMMPEVDGRSALTQIRMLEEDRELPQDSRSKIIMTTALDQRKDIEGAFRDECDSYMIKPVQKDELLIRMRQLGLVE